MSIIKKAAAFAAGSLAAESSLSAFMLVLLIHLLQVFPKFFKECAVWEDLQGSWPGDSSSVERVLVKALQEAFAKTAKQFEQQVR